MPDMNNPSGSDNKKVDDKERLEIGAQAVEALKKAGLLEGKNIEEQRKLVLEAANAIQNEKDRVTLESRIKTPDMLIAGGEQVVKDFEVVKEKGVEGRQSISPEEANRKNRDIEKARLKKEAEIKAKTEEIKAIM